MKFSEREGIVPIRQVLNRKAMPDELKNRLWNIVVNMSSGLGYDGQIKFYGSAMCDFLKRNKSFIPHFYTGNYMRNISKCMEDKYHNKWYSIYEFLGFSYEYFVEIYPKDISAAMLISINHILKEEKSAYRMIDGQFVPLTSEQEIEATESALQIQDKYANAKTHLQNAISLYVDRENPDYGNSIKESIHAVEAVAKVVVGNDNDSFGKLLGKLKADHNLPESLKLALTHLYGYTSNEAGIRHTLQDGQTPPTENDARFMLVICSAFVNYIIGKIET